MLTAIILAAVSWALFTMASAIGFPDGARTEYLRCIEPMAGANYLIPAAGAVVLLGITFLSTPRWRVLFVVVGVTVLALLVWLGITQMACWGLENGSGG